MNLFETSWLAAGKGACPTLRARRYGEVALTGERCTAQCTEECAGLEDGHDVGAHVVGFFGVRYTGMLDPEVGLEVVLRDNSTADAAEGEGTASETCPAQDREKRRRTYHIQTAQCPSRRPMRALHYCKHKSA